jgi:hypothetical protein
MKSEEVFMSHFVLEKCYEERKQPAHVGSVHAHKSRKSMEASRCDKNTEGYLAPQKNENIVTYKLFA